MANLIHALWLLPALFLGLSVSSGRFIYLAGFTPSLLLLVGLAMAFGRRPVPRGWGLAFGGLAATMIGDYFLAYRGARLDSVQFIFGICGFSLAQCCWIGFFRAHGRISWKCALGLALGIGLLYIARLVPATPGALLVFFIGLYSLLSIVSFSSACGLSDRLPGKSAWIVGIGALLFSDVMIGLGAILKIRYWGRWIGGTYLLALVAVTLALVQGAHGTSCGHARRRRFLRWSPCVIFAGALGALACFVAAAWRMPGGPYQPTRRMLSYLGRITLNGQNYAPSHFLFGFGLIIAVLAVAIFYPALGVLVRRRWQKVLISWSGAVHCAGLLIIFFVPEDLSMLQHNAGCSLAVAGAAVTALVICRYSRRLGVKVRVGACAWMLALTAVFCMFLLLHKLRICPFAPYVPTCQKLLIVTYLAWLACLAAALGATRKKGFVSHAKKQSREG